MLFTDDSRLEKIGKCCFQNSGLVSIVVPKNVTSLEESTFQNCRTLRSLAFQDRSRLEKIGCDCFSGSGIESIITPQSLRRIESGAFWNCWNLRRAELNDGLEEVAEGAFSYSGVEHARVPGTLK